MKRKKKTRKSKRERTSKPFHEFSEELSDGGERDEFIKKQSHKR